MRRFSLLDVAPTIASVLGIYLPEPDGRPIEDAMGWECKDVILLIVDSLGYTLYKWLEPDLKNIHALASNGLTFEAETVSNRTTPSIASILSGLTPEHHGICDKAGAKKSSLLSLPEIASSSGLKSAVIMEKSGAEVYDGLIEIIGGISDSLSPDDFDRETCRLSLEALSQRPRLLVSYFIGIDKLVHLGMGPREIRNAAVSIDRYVGEIVRAAQPGTLIILCGDHTVHAGRLKRTSGPFSVALIMSCKGLQQSAIQLR